MLPDVLMALRLALPPDPNQATELRGAASRKLLLRMLQWVGSLGVRARCIAGFTPLVHALHVHHHVI